MKKLFDQVSESCSKIVTESYSTSFTLATKMLDSSIRQDIYNIYGFVRFADEIVDSFHDHNKKDLLNNFHMDIASSVQAVTEEIVLRLTKDIAKEYNIKNLCSIE